MKRWRLVRAIVVLATLAVLVACGETDPLAPDPTKVEREPPPTLDDADAVIGPGENPPPPAFELGFLDRDGFVELRESYDDRHISEEAKALDPYIVPGWDDLAACMSARGYDVRPAVEDERSVPFLRENLDDLVDLVNSHGPNSQRTEEHGLVYTPTDAAVAFFECHFEHVAGSP